MKLREHWNSMSTYEKTNTVINTLRLIATISVPFLTVGLGYFAKYILKW